MNFDRSLLTQVGEGKFGSGEGRRVLWNSLGDAYVVGFEKGAAVFALDSQPKAIIRTSPPTKLHQSRVLQLGSQELFATSTEDGRILFYDLNVPTPTAGDEKLPSCKCVAQLGGQAAEISGRIKDFELLRVETRPTATLLVLTASSDGAVRLWTLPDSLGVVKSTSAGTGKQTENAESPPVQVGSLIGTLETGSRITCLGAFVLDGKTSGDAANGHDDVTTGACEDIGNSD